MLCAFDSRIHLLAQVVLDPQLTFILANVEELVKGSSDQLL
jgi:hypothetical protein